MGAKPSWDTGVVYDDDDIATTEGLAVFHTDWKTAPPKIILLGRADQTGKFRILHTQVREVIAHNPAPTNTPFLDIAVTSKCFGDLGGGGAGLAVRFRGASFRERVRYTPGARLALVVAVTTLVGVIAQAVAGFVGGIVKPGVPFWLLLIVLVVIAVGGFVKFAQDVLAPVR
ncbi:hypothetical protein [Mycobacterium sp.]|uniref:hypothetical protein n=1 Tax=Mycobacterium sp. TaxID=1785 RepID=UPI003F9D12BF